MIREVFPAVEPASPVHDALQRLRETVAADPGLVPSGGARVRAEMLTRAGPGGAVEVRRFLWSVQRTDPAAPGGFTARTLVHGPGAPTTPTTLEFPRDPTLPWLADDRGGLDVHPEATRTDLLRYIPLRRVTVRLHGVPGLPDRVIAKTQRAEDLRSAYAVLRAVEAAVGRAGTVPFRVPQALGLHEAERLLLLGELPGRPLSRSLDGPDERDDPAAMQRLGAVHAALHGLTVGGLATHAVADDVRAARRAAAQVGVLLPSQAGRLTRIVDALAAGAPDDAAPAFCQGDFVPSQVLVDATGWSVLDLDDAHLADPLGEVAALWVALPRELSVKDPGRAGRLREAYLRAYRADRDRPWDEERWRWHLAAARLRLAARRVVKGRAVPGETEAALDELELEPVPVVG